MNQHPINGLMDSSMQNLRQLVDVNTVIGDPIQTPDGTTIIPVSKVTFGFASGGTDFPSSKQPSELFGGGSGGGVTIQPLAFLVVRAGSVQLLQLASNNNTADRVVNLVPEMVDKISGLFSKGEKGTSEDAGKTEPVIG